MYHRFTTKAHSFNKTKKSKQGLICWDVENGGAEKTVILISGHGPLGSSLIQ